MVTLFGTTYYTIGTGLVVLALLAPLFFWFSRWLLRPNVEGQPRRRRLAAEGALTFGLLALAAVGLYWDVYLIGQRAKELCEQTGLVVYRKHSATGFIGSTDIVYWSKFGFAYVEDTVAGRRLRFDYTDGKETRTEVPEFQSQFQLMSDTVSLPVLGKHSGTRFSSHIDKVVDRRTGSPIGQLSELTIGWGWVDRTMLDLTGFAGSPRICGKNAEGHVAFGGNRLALSNLLTEVLEK